MKRKVSKFKAEVCSNCDKCDRDDEHWIEACPRYFNWNLGFANGIITLQNYISTMKTNGYCVETTTIQVEEESEE